MVGLLCTTGVWCAGWPTVCPADSAAQPGGRASLYGQVITADEVTHALADVVLLLDGGPGAARRRAVSGSDGRFRFADLTPGDYLLGVSSPRWHAEPVPVRVADGGEYERVVTVEPRFAEAVTVTATRTERPTSRVPASVSVVGEDEIRRTPMRNLQDLLGTTPGAMVSSRNQGYDASLVLRGAGVNARYGVRDVMVLLDGIPITDPDSLTRLDLLDPTLVESVEVVRGPGSTLWGVNATGGVVNVISRSPLAGRGASARLDLGGGGSVSGVMDLTAPLGGGHVLGVHVSHRESSNDWRPHNRFETTQATVRPCFVLGDAVWENSVTFSDADLELPGRLVLDERREVDQWRPFLEEGTVGVTADPWRHSARTSRTLALGSRLLLTRGAWDLKPTAFLTAWEHEHPVTGRVNRADTLVWGLDLQADRAHAHGVLTAGLTVRSDRQVGEGLTYRDVAVASDGSIEATLSAAPGELMERVRQQTSLAGFYAQESLRLGDRWLLDLGARLDRIRFAVAGHEWLAYDYARGAYGPGAGVLDSASTYTAVNPRAALLVDLNGHHTLYASYATGSQTPTSGEIEENPELVLSRVTGVEVGWKLRASRLSADLALFSNALRDEVVRVVLPQGGSTSVNAGRTEKRGAELALTWRPSPDLTMAAAYTFSRFVFREFSEPVRGRDVDRGGNQIPFVPVHQLVVSAEYRPVPDLRLAATIGSSGEYFLDAANSSTYEGFRAVTDLAASYPVGSVELGLLVQNAFDRRYAVAAEADQSGAVRFVPAPPRSLLLRVGAQLGGGR